MQATLHCDWGHNWVRTGVFLIRMASVNRAVVDSGMVVLDIGSTAVGGSSIVPR